MQIDPTHQRLNAWFLFIVKLVSFTSVTASMWLWAMTDDSSYAWLLFSWLIVLLIGMIPSGQEKGGDNIKDK